jgi:arylsulfatase A-like enzyme
VVRLGDYKLHEYFEDGRLELYDLRRDVGEQTNLAAARPEKTRELLDVLERWRSEVGAPVPTERNPEYDFEADARAIREATSPAP